MTTDFNRTIFVLSVGFAACVAINIFFFPHNTIFPDETRFLDSAQTLAKTGGFFVGDDRAFEMPGTAIFFSAFIYFFGAEGAVLPIRTAQAVLIVAQSVLIGAMARRIFHDRRTALVATTIASFYPFLLFFQGLLLSETLFNTFLVAGFASLYRWRDHGAKIDFSFVLTGLLFALATMTKATLTMLPPVLIAAAALSERRQFSHMGRIFVISAMLYCALLSPWWIRNYAVLGEFVPFTTSAGLNLYLGNNPENRSGGNDWRRDTDPQRFATMLAIPKETDRGRAFTAEAVKYIRKEPSEFIKNMGRKFLRYWSPIPNADTFRGIGFVLISAGTFGPVLVFALISAFRNRKRFGVLAPVYVLFAYFTILHIVVIASLRYRLALEPFLILLASEPIARIVAVINESRKSRLS